MKAISLSSHEWMSRCLVGCLLASVIAAPTLRAQEEADTVARVPELERFHGIIFTLWHDAWPARNVSVLAGLTPEIRCYSDSLSALKLPGIMREKESSWNEQVSLLRETVEEYAGAASPPDSVRLLRAAELLHARYEGLVRAIRPPLRELEAFHRVLYVLYHHQPQVSDTARLSALLGQLRQRMATLERAILPQRLKGKESAFQAARAALSASVAGLGPTLTGVPAESVKKRMERVHTDYVRVAASLE